MFVFFMSQQPLSVVMVFCLFLKGDIQSQAAVRAIARQVCEQLIQSEFLGLKSFF